VEFAGGTEDSGPGPVFATPTVAIAPADAFADYAEADQGTAPDDEYTDDYIDDDADTDAEPEMLVPWAAPAETAETADIADTADPAELTEEDAGDPYDEVLEPFDDAPRVPPYDDAELAAVHRVIR